LKPMGRTCDQRVRCRVFLQSFGCSSNVADGEFMAGCLAEAGFELVRSAREANVVIYNTCAVKTPTENRAVEILKRAGQMRDKRLVITGCLPLINPKRLEDEVQFDAALGPSCGSSIVDVVQKAVTGQSQILLKPKHEAKSSLLLPRLAANPVIGIVPVAQGCLGACSYCCVVFARGRLRSHSIQDIVKRVEADLDAGVREIWLTGQDMASYGRDIGVDLADLLRVVCSLERGFSVRVGMMTPNLVLDMLPDLVEAFRNEHMFKFVHLPIQSGDDQVLKRMNRLYTTEEFTLIVEAFRNALPSMTLATDVICGFPGETDEAFERTLRLIENTKPDVVNISKFFSRPRTAAEAMSHKVPPQSVTARSRRMANLVQRISHEKNKAWINWQGQVLVDECGKQPGTFIGRNFAYKPIVIKSSDERLLGKFVNVRVAKAFQTYLEAEIVDLKDHGAACSRSA